MAGYFTQSVILICVLLKCLLSYGQLVLYMPEEETQKLLGVETQVMYLYKIYQQDHALRAQLVLNASHNQHVLYWQNTSPDKQMQYGIEFLFDYPDGLVMPIKLNISSSGVIPTQLSAMMMTFNCTGSRIAVQIRMRLNITGWLGDGVTSVVLNRKKICVAGGSALSANVGQDSSTGSATSYKVGGGVNPIVGVPTTDRSEIGGHYNLPKPTSTEIFYVAVGIASGVIILVAVIIFTLYMRTRRQTMISNERPSVIGSSNHGSSFMRLDGNKASSSASLPSSRRAGTPSSYSQIPSVQDIEITLESVAISRQSVTLGDIILEGAFGRLCQGVVYVQDETEHCYEQKVLIKTINDDSTEDQVHCMLVEGSIFKGLNNQYLNPLIAVCIEKPTWLIYPHCEHGNLKSLLSKSNRISEQSLVLNTKQLVFMALQVAKGLHYLHRKHNIKHKDVAARNCFVDSSLNVKVTDNALAQDLFPNDYVCLGSDDLRPVKWMALECLLHKKYTEATDTWSFGVLLWELITMAQQPYSDVEVTRYADYLQGGFRLLQPPNCPDLLYAVMACCWAMHPSDRPNFSTIVVCLQDFHSNLSQFV